MGTYNTKEGNDKKNGFSKTKKVEFGKPFEQTPKVVASISEFDRYQDGTGDVWWGLNVTAHTPTPTSFELFLKGVSTEIESVTATWIACE